MNLEKDPVYGNIYRFHTTEEERVALEQIRTIIAPYDLSVEMLHEGIMSRGVQGDEGTYTRVIVLSGNILPYEVLQELSTQITNRIPINRVLFTIKTT